MSSITLPSIPVQDMLIQFADELKISQFALNETRQNLERLRFQSTPIALNSAFQNELNLVHNLYQRLLDLTIQNIKAQHAISGLIHTDVSDELINFPDRQFIRILVKRISQDLVPLEKKYQDYKKANEMLAARISILTTVQSPAMAGTNFWESVKLCSEQSRNS